MPFVFDRFRQADATYARAHGGLGLGLSISRHLVELHGGTIAAESDGPGQGATFRVRLPLAIGDAGPPMGLRSLHRRPARPGLSALGDLRHIDVLVVDDEQDVRDLVATILGGCGASMTTAVAAVSNLARMGRALH